LYIWEAGWGLWWHDYELPTTVETFSIAFGGVVIWVNDCGKYQNNTSDEVG
jgi:hypothetical protein